MQEETIATPGIEPPVSMKSSGEATDLSSARQKIRLWVQLSSVWKKYTLSILVNWYDVSCILKNRHRKKEKLIKEE